MDRLGGAYLYARSDQLDASREERNHVVDHMEMIIVRESCVLRIPSSVWLLQRDRLWLARVSVDKKKNVARKKMYGKTLASLTRFTSAGPNPHAQLCCFSGILSAIRYSFSLSFHLLPSSQLSRTTAETYTVPLLARVHRVSFSRGLYSREITASWGPVVARSSVDHTVEKHSRYYILSLFHLFWFHYAFINHVHIQIQQVQYIWN